MCEILIHRGGRGDPLDAADWQPFDVVAIREDWQNWGRKEKGRETSFFVVELPNIPRADAVHLMDEHQINEGTVVAPKYRMLRRRKRTFFYNSLPKAMQDVVTGMGSGVILFSGWRIRLIGRDRQAFLDAAVTKWQ